MTHVEVDNEEKLKEYAQLEIDNNRTIAGSLEMIYLTILCICLAKQYY